MSYYHHRHNEDKSDSSREESNVEHNWERNAKTKYGKSKEKSNSISAMTNKSKTTTTTTTTTTTKATSESSHKIHKEDNHRTYNEVNNNRKNNNDSSIHNAIISKSSNSSSNNSNDSVSNHSSHSNRSSSLDSCNSDTTVGINSVVNARRRRQLLSPEPNPIPNETEKGNFEVMHDNNSNANDITSQPHLTCSDNENTVSSCVHVDCAVSNNEEKNKSNRHTDEKDKSHNYSRVDNNNKTVKSEHSFLPESMEKNEHTSEENNNNSNDSNVEIDTINSSSYGNRLKHVLHEPSPSPSLPIQIMQSTETFMESPSPCICNEWHSTQYTSALYPNSTATSNKKVSVINTDNSYNTKEQEEEQSTFTSPSIQMTAPSQEQQYTLSGTPLRFSNTSIITSESSSESSSQEPHQEKYYEEELEEVEKEYSHSYEELQKHHEEHLHPQQHHVECHSGGFVHLPRQSFSTSTSTSSTLSSSTSSSSSSPELHSPSPMRALNAAFTLSPRAESETKDFEPLSVNWFSGSGNRSLSSESYALSSISGIAHGDWTENKIANINNSSIISKSNMMNLHDGYVVAIELDQIKTVHEKEENNDIALPQEAINANKEKESDKDESNITIDTAHINKTTSISPVKYETRTVFINLSRLEERRTFVTSQCVEYARCMSNKNILESLLPALLTSLECDDYGESFDNCSMCMLNSLPEVIKCMLPDIKESRLMCTHNNNNNNDSSIVQRENENVSIAKWEFTFNKKTMSYFVGLLLTLCCGAEHSIIEPAIHCFTQLMEILPIAVLSEVMMPVLFALRSCFWATPRAIAAGTLGKLALTLCRRSITSTRMTTSHKDDKNNVNNHCTNCNNDNSREDQENNSSKDTKSNDCVHSKCGVESINTVSLTDWVHIYEDLAQDDVCEVRTFAVIGLKDWIELFLHLLTTLSLPSSSLSTSSSSAATAADSQVNQTNERYSGVNDDNLQRASCDTSNTINEDVNEECTRYAMYKLRQRAYKELLLQHIVPLVRSFTCDDLSDTVRFTLVNEMHSMACVMGRTLSAKFLLPVLLSAVHDRSWRVRFTLANNMSGIISLLMTSSTQHNNKDSKYKNNNNNNNNNNQKEEIKNKNNNSKSQINASSINANTTTFNSNNENKGDISANDKFVNFQNSKTVLGQILHTLSEDEECSVRAALASQLKSILAEVKMKYAHLSFIMENDTINKANNNATNNYKSEYTKMSKDDNEQSSTDLPQSVNHNSKSHEKEIEDKRSVSLSEGNELKGVHIAQICLPVVLKLATDADSHVRRNASSCLGLLLILLPCPVPSMFITQQIHPLTVVCNSITSLMKDRVLGVQLDALAGLKEMVNILVLTQENMHKGNKNSRYNSSSSSKNIEDENIKGNTSSKKQISTSSNTKEFIERSECKSKKSLENNKYGKAYGNATNEDHKSSSSTTAVSSHELVGNSATNKEEYKNNKCNSVTYNVQKLSEVCIMTREDFNKRMTIIHSTVIATLLDLGKSSTSSTYNNNNYSTSSSIGFKCNNSWHVRREVLTAVKYFCALLSEEQFSPLMSFISKCLVDAVHAVRCTALDSLGYVASFYGAEYAAQLLTNILLTSKSNHHSHQINNTCKNNKGNKIKPSASKESSTLSTKTECSVSLSLSLSSTHSITSSSFVWRVMDIRVLEILLPTVAQLPHKDLRRMHLMNLALELLTNYARDEVSNVRLALAECLKTFCLCYASSAHSAKRNDDENNCSCNSINSVDGTSNSKHVLEHNNFEKIIDILQNDADNDVQITALNVQRTG